MVDEDGVAAEEKVLREHHAAAIGRMNRRAGRGPQVRARMRRARLSVEHAPMTEVAPAVMPGIGEANGSLQ